MQVNGQSVQPGGPPQLINGNLVNLAKGGAVWIETPGKKPILAGWIRDNPGSSPSGIPHWIPSPSGLGDGDPGPPTLDHWLGSLNQEIAAFAFTWDPSDPTTLQLDGNRILPGATPFSIVDHTFGLSKAGDIMTIDGHEYPVMDVWNRELNVATPWRDSSSCPTELDSDSDYVLDGKTLNPGGPAITISGTVFSLMADGVLIEGISRWPFSSKGVGDRSSGPATPTLDGTTYILDGDGDYIDDHHVTLDPHLSASATESQQMLVTTPALSTDDDIGNVFMNGFGPSAAVSTSKKSAGSHSSLTPNLIRDALICSAWMLFVSLVFG